MAPPNGPTGPGQPPAPAAPAMPDTRGTQRGMQSVVSSAREFTDALREQQRIAQELQGILEKMSQTMGSSAGSMAQSTNSVTDSVRKAEKTIKAEETATSKMAKTSEKAAKVLKGTFAKSADIASSALSGLLKGLQNFYSLTKAAGGFIGGLVDGLFSVGKAIISIPFKMMQGLFKMAEQGGGGTELAQAYENVREQFGDLKSGISKTVIDVAAGMGKLDSTGVSAQRIFGNVAQRTEIINKMAMGMGMTIGHFTDELRTNGEALARFQLGLGLSDQELEAVNRTALRTGKTATSVFTDMTKQTMGMSKAFGLNAKILSKEMGKAIADTAHFAHLSNKEMAAAVAYANKLGLSIDKLTASMDATATFDQAAESMGKVNETFGSHIDATEVMMAQNPGEKFEIIRKGLLATGRDMTKLNYQERMLLKQQTGWDDATLDAAVSTKNLGVSFDKMSAQASKNANTVVSQTDALKELSVQMKRIVDSGPQSQGGIVDRFVDGMMKGIQSSPEFMKIMQNIKQVFASAYMAGMKLGRMFVDLFPGVKQTFKGLADLFDPARFTKMFNGIIKAFDVFKAGGTGKVEDFMKMIKENFFSFFNKEQKGGKDVLEGMKTFFGTVIQLFSKFAVFAIKELSKLLITITDWIKNPSMPKMGAAPSFAILEPLLEVFKTAKDVLWPVLKDLAATLFDKLKKAIVEMSPKSKMIIGGVIGSIVLGPAIMNAVTAAVSSGVFGKASTKLGAAVAGAAANASQGTRSAAMGAAAAMPNVSQSPAAMVSSSIPDAKTTMDMETAANSKIDWKALTAFLVGIAGMFFIGMQAFGKALEIVKGYDFAEIGKASLMFGAISTFMIPMAKAGTIMMEKKLNAMDWKAFGQVLIGIGSLMAIGVAGFTVGLYAVKKLNPSLKDIGMAEALMLAMIPPVAATGLLVAEARLVGSLVDKAKTEVITGMAAMGITMVAIVGTAYLVMKALGGFNANKMKAVAMMMDVITNTFMKTGVILLEAAAIGAAITSTGGVAALVAGAGLAAMATAVGVIAKTASEVMVYISGIKDDPAAFLMKTVAFTLVMDSVGKMMGQISGILKALDFGFFESESSKIAKMDAARKMIQALINGENGKGGINGIIISIVDGLKTLTPDKLETTKAFASVLTAVSGVMTAASKSIEALQSKSIGWFTTAEQDQATIKVSMESGSKYVSTIMGSTRQLVTTIIDSLKSIPDSSKFKESGAAMGAILQAVASMISAIGPNVKDFQKSAEGSVSGGLLGPKLSGKQSEIDAAGITAVANYMTMVLGAIKNHVPVMINAIMSGVGNTLSRLDKTQLDALPAVGEVLKTVASIITSISASTKGMGNVSVAASQGAVVNIVNQMPSLSQIFDEIAKSAPELIKKLISTVDVLPKDKGFAEKIKLIGETIDIFGKMIKMTTEIGGAGKDANMSVDAMGPLANGLMALKGFLKTLAGDADAPYKELGMKDLTALMNKIPIDKKAAAQSKSVAEALGGIFMIASAIKDPLREVSAAQQGNVELTVRLILGGIHGMLKVLAEDSELNLGVFVSKLGSIGKLLPPGYSSTVGVISKNISDTFAQINKMSEMIGGAKSMSSTDATKRMTEVKAFIDTIPGGMKQVKESLDKLLNKETGVQKIQDGALVPTIAAVQDMTMKTRQLDQALSALPVLNFPAKLEAVAKGMGFAGKFSYTIQSKEVVINLALKVEMDAGAVEKAVVLRKDSIIRDRLNFAMGSKSGNNIAVTESLTSTNPNPGFVANAVP